MHEAERPRRIDAAAHRCAAVAGPRTITVARRARAREGRRSGKAGAPHLAHPRKKSRVSEVATQLRRRTLWPWQHSPCFSVPEAFAAIGGKPFAVRRERNGGDGAAPVNQCAGKLNQPFEPSDMAAAQRSATIPTRSVRPARSVGHSKLVTVRAVRPICDPTGAGMGWMSSLFVGNSSSSVRRSLDAPPCVPCCSFGSNSTRACSARVFSLASSSPFARASISRPERFCWE